LANYTEVLESVLQLTPTEREKLLRVLSSAAQQGDDQSYHRITELKGLGKGTWEGVDAQEFVRQERDSWDE